MDRLLLTLDCPASDLALDEALLDQAEEVGPACEYLRIWEAPRPYVVVGRSSRVDDEVNTDFCVAQGIPILRRSSGGAAIVAGPGCLMYAVVLSHKLRPELRGVPETHGYVLGRIAGALEQFVPTVQHAGTSDLAFKSKKKSKKVSGTFCAKHPAGRSGKRFLTPFSRPFSRKFSGNSLRVKRTHSLYHGTLLYDFDLSLIAECLKMPERQPDYRSARDHTDFVDNLPVSRSDLQEALLAAWPTHGEAAEWPQQRVNQLAAEKYSRDDWNLEYGRPAAPKAGT